MDFVANSLCLITFQLKPLLGGWPFNGIANAVEQLEFTATLGANPINGRLIHLDEDIAGGLMRAGGIEGIEAVAS